jgi:hypothetical protein
MHCIYCMHSTQTFNGQLGHRFARLHCRSTCGACALAFEAPNPSLLPCPLSFAPCLQGARGCSKLLCTPTPSPFDPPTAVSGLPDTLQAAASAALASSSGGERNDENGAAAAAEDAAEAVAPAPAANDILSLAQASRGSEARTFAVPAEPALGGRAKVYYDRSRGPLVHPSAALSARVRHVGGWGGGRERK